MTDHTCTEKIGGDSIFIFVVIQLERETVMTAWRLHWELRESGLLIEFRIFENNGKMVLFGI